MAKQKFNIGQSSAGISAKTFIPPIPSFTTKPEIIISSVVTASLKKTFIQTGFEPEDKPLSRSKMFNTDVYTDLEFEGGNYVDENGKTITYSGLKIELVLMNVMNTKNIIETTLQGRNGTVKEYISNGDYQIKITGKLYSDGANQYPAELVDALIGICLVPDAVVVNSSYLKMFENTSRIVIKSYELDQEEGTRNYQSFVLNCVSDRDLILLKNA